MVELDIAQIKADFSEVIEYSQGFTPELDSLFDKWLAAKGHFIDRMGGLIYEVPGVVSIALTADELEQRKEKFFEWVGDICSHSLEDFFRLNSESFFENKVIKTNAIKGLRIGMKLGKAVRKAYSDYYRINEVLDKYSEVINDINYEGRLCLSVHPLDFLSVSENASDWRSCHALDGEYRTGNLSLMVDNCTIIAYLKSSDKNVPLKRFGKVKWNDKKWRCFFFFDSKREIVWASRQYPFSSVDILNKVDSLLFKKFNYFTKSDRKPLSIYSGKHWMSPILKGSIQVDNEYQNLRDQYVVFRGIISPLSKYIVSHPKAMHYDDIHNSTVYTAQFLPYSDMSFFKHPDAFSPLVVGESVPCLVCGANTVNHSEVMFCNDCILTNEELDVSGVDDLQICCICGERTLEEDDWAYDGEYYCRDCYNEKIHTCEQCGELFYTDDPDQTKCMACLHDL